MAVRSLSVDVSKTKLNDFTEDSMQRQQAGSIPLTFRNTSEASPLFNAEIEEAGIQLIRSPSAFEEKLLKIFARNLAAADFAEAGSQTR